MKTAIIFGILLLSQVSMAQVNNHYWVVETNPNLNISIVRFYNDENLLVKEFSIKNKLLSVTRPGHKRFLNRKLREAEKENMIVSAKR